MQKIVSVLFVILVFGGCAKKDPYDISQYYNPKEQDAILTSIINYIFIAPPYTLMKDRFESKHREFYSSSTSKFKIYKYFISADSTHYFYLSRPASIASERRAVGGHFKMNKKFQLSDFREEFVTPTLTEEAIKTKAVFLFDEMVKGNLSNYIGMKDYVQWPGGIYLYDTGIYEWKLKPEVVN
jgi:hypothetical protein